MKNIQDFIFRMKDLGISIYLNNEDLKITAPKNVLTPELINEIKKLKIEIIDFFKKSSNDLYDSYTLLKPAILKNYYPLSSAQKRLYLLQQMDLNSTTYNMPNLISLGKNAVLEKIEDVFLQLIDRHESLRTSFEVVDEVPVQRVHKTVDFWVEEYSIEELDEQDTLKKFIQPFDLTRPPLLRVAKVEKGEESLLMLDIHHIISDMVTLNILEEEFHKLFNGEKLPALKLQYKDYSEWQNNEEYRFRIKEQEGYWIKQFEGEIPVLNLPLDYVRPSMQSSEGATVNFSLSREDSRSIKTFTEENGLTLNITLLSAFTILLSKLSGQEDIIIGIPITGRNHSDLEGVVGMFVNSLAIRNEVRGNEKVKDFVSRLKQVTLDAYENQEYQFEDLVERLSLSRDISRNPIFDVMFNLMVQREHIGIQNGFETHQLIHTPGVAKFDMTLTVVVYGEQLLLNFEYCTKLFREKPIERYIGYLKQIVNQIATIPEIRISEIEILSAEEKYQLLYEFNNTMNEYPRDKSIHQLFEEQVEKTPDRIVVIKDDIYISYNELNNKSNQIAWHLVDMGIRIGDVVGLMVERSEFLIASILGILKSGAAYLPLNKDWPEERRNFMLSDSCCSIMFCENIPSNCINKNYRLLDIHDTNLYNGNTENLNVQITSSNIIYIIYTSGTTGVPKGVLTTHSNVSRVVLNSNYLCIDKRDRILQLSSYTFDGSVFDIYGVLLNGSSLIMLNNDDVLSLNKLLDIILKKQVSIFFLTTALFNTIVDYGMSKLKDVNKILFGGERISTQHTHKAIQELGENKLVHVYGPTETTVFASYYNINDIDVKELIIPIGKPISNTNIYLFDKYMKLVPKGVIGEIYIGGQGNALGYLNNIELTSDKFVINPYDITDILYKTGDLGRMQLDGSIEFLGRIDHQVKIRGFRVELGEIENCLLKHPFIDKCIVLAKEDNGDKFLCAYIVGEEKFTQEEIRDYLSKSLPDYMIPSYHMVIDEFPLTTNGKINLRALPTPDVKADDEYMPPSNALESILIKIWSEVLNVPNEKISVTANFFSMGGHSLKASILTGKIHKETDIEFHLREVFIYPTIREQAAQLRDRGKNIFEFIPKAQTQDYYSLSFAQKRLYILQQLDQRSIAYNMPYTISLGYNTNKSKVEEVFLHLINRHEILRTSFEVHGEEPVQRVLKEVDFKIEKYTIEKSEELATRKGFIRPFDLSQAPLLRVAIVEIQGEGSLLMLDMHHIISDGVSQNILEKEFQQLYSGETLPLLKLQYKDYSEWQRSLEQQEKRKEQESYWLKQFEEGIPILTLPIDYTRPLIQSHEGANVCFTLSREETANIKLLGERNGLTLYMSILSAFSILLSKLSGQENIVIGTPVTGRNHIDLEPIVGLFVNTLAICTTVIPGTKIKKLIREVRQNTLKAFENSDYQFENLVEKVLVNRDNSRNPVFDVMFNLLNQREYTGDLNDLKSKPLIHTPGVAKFDMTLTAVDYGEQIMLNLGYCTMLFKPDSIERYIKYFRQIVGQITFKQDCAISEIEVLSLEERNQLLYEFNNTKRDYPSSKAIHHIIEEQAAQSPDRIAIVFENEHISYAEFNKKSNQLEYYLRNRGIKDNSTVGLLIDPSVEMLVCIMGVLKAGAAFMPISPESSENRVTYMLNDTESDLILKKSVKSFCSISNIEIVDLNHILTDEYCDGLKENNFEHRHNYSLAYVIYTSGTTGKPKGVLISHQNIINYIDWFNETIRIVKSDRAVLTTTYTFDAIYTLLFGALFHGARLSIIPRDVYLNPENLVKYIDKECITLLKMTPTLFNSVVNYGILKKENLETLRFLMIGGEAINASDVEKFYKMNSTAQIMNHYGPTETTVGSIATFIDTSNFSEYIDRLYIGKPIANTHIYILNSTNKLQPIGVLGELFISGTGLAQGYLNNPELTKEKFIEHPFREGEMLYRTGDLARWFPDGNIEFLGRIDNQVKIRGHRIELGEVENVLLKHKNIQESVVIVREDNGNKFLCAYMVCTREVDKEELRAYLSARLPEYMVPSYYVTLEKLPVNSNGKIDRKSLPSPEYKVGLDYVAPSNDLEKKLAAIWSEVLGIPLDKVSIHDNFFSIGGNSLNLVRLHKTIVQKVDVQINIVDLFNCNTISRLTKLIISYQDECIIQKDQENNILKF